MWEYNYDYLSHHGILGQKWGVRRFQNPDGSLTAAGKRRYKAESVEEINSAKGITRRLNDLDTGMAYNQRDYRDNLKKHDKYQGTLKLFGKASKYQNKYETNKKNIEKGTEETLKLLEIAKNKGYDISAKDIERYAKRGIDYWGQSMFGVAGIPITISNIKKNTFAGKQYKVTEDEYDKKIQKIEKLMESNEKERDSAPTYMNKKSWNETVDQAQNINRNKITKLNALKSAKTEDKWDANFLEAIQNSKIFDAGDTKAMLKEYNKYLDDPQDYWKNKRNKLEQA